VLVTREADYAIRCVIEVVRHGRISAAQVAEIQGISPTFLGKIVQSLAKAGILATRRGVGGGIALGVPVDSLTLLQVIEAVEGPLCLNECLTTPPQCAHLETCPAYSYLKQAQVSLRDILNVSFAEVLEGFPQPPIPDSVERPAWLPNGNGDVRRVARTGDAP
jgi:Rrf2 family protein